MNQGIKQSLQPLQLSGSIKNNRRQCPPIDCTRPIENSVAPPLLKRRSNSRIAKRRVGKLIRVDDARPQGLKNPCDGGFSSANSTGNAHDWLGRNIRNLCCVAQGQDLSGIEKIPERPLQIPSEKPQGDDSSMQVFGGVTENYAPFATCPLRRKRCFVCRAYCSTGAIDSRWAAGNGRENSRKPRLSIPVRNRRVIPSKYFF